MVNLDSANYSIWKIRIEDYLCSKDLLDPILYKERPTGVDEKAWTTLNQKAIASIRQYVSLSVLQHVANETNAFEMWKKLESMYERNNAMRKASLIRKLVKLQYKDGDSIVVHMNEFQGVVNQLAGTKMKLEDELQALLLLSSLPDSWDTLVVSLSNSAPDGKMTMEMVKASLLNEDAMRKESSYPSQAEENVILESSRGRSKSRNPHYSDKSRGDPNPEKEISFAIIVRSRVTLRDSAERKRGICPGRKEIKMRVPSRSQKRRTLQPWHLVMIICLLLVTMDY
ncbi:unnamed protein product [Cuscuta campestris]|uniref:DUF4219 domain-containing protein n=1 Tax=Cuscuta campestris TaxID=132261 RepID=A0A484N587_9ASTE|nr:unnamed protein product [Cuscuta campestris]